MAESELKPDATNGPGDNTPPSIDRGILQINDYWHKEVPDSVAFDPPAAFKWAYGITSGGTDWHQWSTDVSGAYKQYIAQVQAAIA